MHRSVSSGALRGALAGLLAATLAACTPRAVIPDAERDRVARELDGRTRYLRVAVHASPLYGDGGMLLLSDQPPSELDLVRTPGGSPVPPPKAERILPPGTQVKIREVEFPTAWIIARRVVMTPRYHPWAILELPGEPRPAVIVLSQVAATYDEIRGELERILAVDDPGVFLKQLPPDQRDAVLRKELVEGMGPRAVEMAWGLPERKRIDRPAGNEEWTWPGGARSAFLQDERLVRWERK